MNLDRRTWELVWMWQGHEPEQGKRGELVEQGHRVRARLEPEVARDLDRAPEQYWREIRAALAVVGERGGASGTSAAPTGPAAVFDSAVVLATGPARPASTAPASAPAAPAAPPGSTIATSHGDGGLNLAGSLSVGRDIVLGGAKKAEAAPVPAASDEARGQAEPRVRILFLAANPSDGSHLELDREARAIQQELERAGHGASFELVTRWAVEPMDLLRELRKLKPTVVHFSGHGVAAGGDAARSAGRTVVPSDGPSAPSRAPAGLLLHGAGGGQVVSAEALGQLFRAAGSAVRLVVLSACYSEEQALAIGAHVDCVVGMGGAILDSSARQFSIGLYGGVGERESVAQCFAHGQLAISLAGLPDSSLPQLYARPGIDPATVVLGPREAAS